MHRLRVGVSSRHSEQRQDMITRWGIASAGRISHDFTNAIVGVLPDHKVILFPTIQ